MKKSLASEGAIYIFGSVLNKGMSFLLLPLYTSYLTVGDFGVVSVCGAVASVVSVVSTLGLDGALTRFYFDHEEEKRREIIGSIIGLSFLINIIVLAIATTIGAFFSNNFFKEISFWPFLCLSLITASLSSLPSLFFAYLRASRNAIGFLVLQVFQFLSQALTVIVLVVMLHGGALGRVEADTLARSVIFVIALVWVIRKTQLKFWTSNSSKILDYAIPLVPHALGWWIMSLSDRLIMQYYLPVRDVGIYSLATTFGMLVLFLADAINNAWAPYFFGQASSSENYPRLALQMKVLLLLFVVVTLLVGAFSAPLITLIAKRSEYHAAIQYVPIISLGYFFIALYSLYCNQMFFVKKTKILAMITGTMALFNIIVKTVLMPRYGLPGCAVATVVVFFLYFLAVMYFSNREMHLPIDGWRVFSVVGIVFTGIIVISWSFRIGYPIYFPIFIALFASFAASMFLLTSLDRHKVVGMFPNNRSFR